MELVVVVVFGLALAALLYGLQLGRRVERLEQTVAALRDALVRAGERPRVEEQPAATPSPAAPEPASTTDGPATPEPSAPAPVPPPLPTAPPPAPDSVPAFPPDKPSRSPNQVLEAFVGGRLLLIAGVVTVLFGLGFFLKFAFDRDLIGPLGRVITGLLLGVAALVGGDQLYRRGLKHFAQGLMGLGLGALYLSIYFASVRYGLVGRQVAFVGTAFITALGATLALWRNGPLLAWLGFVGGLMAPALLGSNEDSLEWLAAWLVLVDVGLAIVLLRRRWMGLELLSLVASCVYMAFWYDAHYALPRQDAAAVVFLTRALAVMGVSLLPSMLTPRRLDVTALLAAFGAGVAAVMMGWEMLESTREYELAGGIVFLALCYLGSGWMIESKRKGKRRDADLLYAIGLAGFATVVPLLLGGKVVAPVWAAGGVAATYFATVRKRTVFVVCGFAMCVLAMGNLLFELPMHRGEFLLFVNGPFLAYASPFVALAACGQLLIRRTRAGGRTGRIACVIAAWTFLPVLLFEVAQFVDYGLSVRGDKEDAWVMGFGALALGIYSAALALPGRSVSRAYRSLAVWPLFVAVCWTIALMTFGHEDGSTAFVNVPFLGAAAIVAAAAWSAYRSYGAWRVVYTIGAALLLFGVITGEIYQAGENAMGDREARQAARHAAQVWVSIAWTLLAATSITVGFLRRLQGFRWAGIGIFALTLAKVFLVDLAMLETVYRIGSFMVLGLLLVGASYVYQRFSAGLDPEEPTTAPPEGDALPQAESDPRPANDE